MAEGTRVEQATQAPWQAPRVGFGILLFIITLGFYGWYWIFKTMEEIRQHTGRGPRRN